MALLVTEMGDGNRRARRGRINDRHAMHFHNRCAFEHQLANADSRSRSSFAIGTAMENSGLVAAISGTLVPDPKALSPFVVLIILYVMTNVATELISNNAAAVLMFPFAVRFADNLGVEPRPFIMAVVMAASAAFALPLGYQTHLMVYGPGGYKLGDFLRVGLVMDLLIGICALLVIPLVWKF